MLSACVANVPPTWTLPMLIGVVTVLAEARRKTLPLIVIVCAVRLVLPRPLVPVPSEVNATEAVPLLAPAVAVLALAKPTIKLVLSVAVGPNRLNEPPLLLAPPVCVPKLASNFSLKPSLAAVFWMLSVWVPKESPTWMLPRLTGVVIVLGDARR